MKNLDVKIKRCKELDRIGFEILKKYGIKPYKVRLDVREDADRRAANRLYKKLGLNVDLYCMHHTLNLYVVPVPRDKHKEKHFGGVELHHLRRKERA